MKIIRNPALLGLLLLSSIYSLQGTMAREKGAFFTDSEKNGSKSNDQQAPILKGNAEALEALIKSTSKPVVVECYHPTCLFCKGMGPIFEELANEENQYVFASVDCVNNPEIHGYKANAFPTFLVFKNGLLWGTILGTRTKEQLMRKLEAIARAENPIETHKPSIKDKDQFPVGIAILGLFGFMVGVEWWYSDL